MEQNIEYEQFYEKIAQDSRQALIQLISEAGHGKTNAMRTVVEYVKEHQPDIEFVILDVSQAWYENAPVKYRQLVTREKIENYSVDYTVTDCVYEMGELSDVEKRLFVGLLVKYHYEKRYKAKLRGELEKEKYLVFVFEESNIYFGSYSFRRNDEYSGVFQNFVSVGRNYRMRGFLIATAEAGEMAPSLRRRSRKIYGRVESEDDLRVVRRKYKDVAEYLKGSPKYTFVYISDKPYGPVKTLPSGVHTPVDYEVKVVRAFNHYDAVPMEVKPQPVSKLRWFIYGVLSVFGAVFGLILIILAACAR